MLAIKKHKMHTDFDKINMLSWGRRDGLSRNQLKLNELLCASIAGEIENVDK